jgi:hypothetical protein
MRDVRRVAVPRFRARCGVLFGPDGLAQKLQAAFERGHSSVDDWLSGRNVPLEVLWLIQLLETTPPAVWPDRWKTAKGIVASTQVDRIRSLLDLGSRPVEVATLLGVSRQSVSQIIIKHTLQVVPRNRRGKTTNSRPARTWCIGAAACLQATDLNDAEICRSIGVSAFQLSAARRFGKLAPRKSRRRNLIPADIDRILKMRATGISPKAIATTLGRSIATVYVVLQRHKTSG